MAGPWRLGLLEFQRGRVRMNLAGEIYAIEYGRDPSEDLPGFMRVNPPTELELAYHRPEGEIMQSLAGIVTGIVRNTFHFSACLTDGTYDTGQFTVERREDLPAEGEEFIMISYINPAGQAKTHYGGRLPVEIRDVRPPARPDLGELEKLVGGEGEVLAGMSCVVTGTRGKKMDVFAIDERGQYFTATMPCDMLPGKPSRGTEFYLPSIKPAGKSEIVQRAYPKR